jgi:hypothetical protein
LKYFYDKWTELTDDNTILNWVKGYTIPFNELPMQALQPKNNACNSHSQIINIDNCITELLTSEFISPCTPCEGQFISPIFTVPKPNGKHRFILNLKMINRYIDVNHFKMEDHRTALKLLQRNYYMASIDLQDAYFLISIDENYKKFLRFEWKSQTYEFNVLPFGICTAPYVFTKLLKPVLQYLRSSGLMSVAYLDDFLCIGQTYDECLKNITTTKAILEYLGFIINTKKSVMVPNKTCKFLGFNFDTKHMIITLPVDKKTRIRNKTIELMGKRNCTIRQFAEFIGLLTSACPAVNYGWMYTKLFEREKFLALNYSQDYNRRMKIESFLNIDFLWWIDKINSSFCPIRKKNYCMEIFSDASNTGWGIACGDQSANGNWTESELHLHINTLELKAAYYGLKIFTENIRDCDILLRIDNTTAISYINRMGGVQHPHLNGLAREIWQWCEKRNIYIFASYIKSCENVIADRESRRINIDTEWAIHQPVFERITNLLGTPEFDLFASAQNNKCTRYASWKLDPFSEVVDSFTFNWHNINFYAFPPFSLIARVLEKIITDQAEGILIVPYWPSQPWYPLWSKLVISKKYFFGPDKTLLNSPFRTCHPLHADLVLVAAKLSGTH